MKTLFRKQKYVRLVSTLLVCCMLAGVVGVPMDAKATTITANDLYVHNQSGSGVEIRKQDTNVGVKCTYVLTGGGYSFYNRVGSAGVCNMSTVGTGMHLELQDITGRDGAGDENYVLVLAIGDNKDAGGNQKEANRAWYKNDHGNATILAVRSEGAYKAYIKASNTAADVYPAAVTEGVITSGTLQHELDGSISIDIVRKGTNGNKWTYDVTVNGETFEIYTPNYVENPYINFGLLHNGTGAANMANNVGASFVVTDFSSIEPIGSVTLSESSLHLDNVGDTATLTATVNPSGAPVAVKWTTGNPEVATVENGTVTAVGIGRTEITATVGGKTATCSVQVGERPASAPSIYNKDSNPGGKITNNTALSTTETFTGVQVTYATNVQSWQRVYTRDLHSLAGEGFDIKFEDITPTEGNYSLLVAFGQSSSEGDPFYNSNAYVAYYDKDGDFIVIKGAEGKTPTNATVLYATKMDPLGNELTMNFRKSEDNTQTIITVNGIECMIPDIDTSARRFNLGIMGGFNVDYETDKVTGLNYYGPVSDYSSSAISFTITGFQSGFGITASPSVTLLKGTQTQLKALVTPANADNQDITWVSADESIVKVVDDKTGLIQGLSAGETTVTATTIVGGKTATCKVTVVEDSIGGYYATTGIKLEKSEEKITAEYAANSAVISEQLHTDSAYDVQKGIHLEIPSVTVADGSDYTVAVAFGNQYVQGYNKDGYIIAYNRAGYFGIFTTKDCQENPIEEKNRLVMLKRENYSGSLTIDLIQKEDNYLLTVNGATYHIPALEGEKELYFAISLLGGAMLQADADGNNRWVGVSWNDVTFGEGTSLVVHKPTEDYQSPELPTVDDVEKAETLTADEMVVKSGKFDIKEKKGLKITYNSESNYYSRMVTAATHSARKGIHIELADIAPSEAWGDDYAIGISFGNSDEQWFNKAGYMMVYDSYGNFQIMATKEGSDLSSGTRETVIYVKRERLENSLEVDLKRHNDMYVLTVNGKTYTLAAENDIYPLTSTKNLYIGFGIMDGGKIGTGEFNVIKGSSDGNKPNGTLVGATYTIKKLFSVKDAGQDDKNIPPSWLGYNGSAFTFKETEDGADITHVLGAAAWERFSIKKPYLSDQAGVTYTLKDIYSESDDYSIVFGFGGTGHIWYDNKGVMLVYGRSGNLAILAPSGIKSDNGGVENLNSAEVIASEKIEFKDSLIVNVRTSGDGYLFTINGHEYYVAGEYLGQSNQVYVQLGVMGDFELNNGDVSQLEYYQAGFRNKTVSFTLEKPVGVIATDEEIPGTQVNPKDYGMFFVREAEHLLLYEADNGVRFVHTADALGWERISWSKRFTPQGNGIHLELEDITSKGNRYTIAAFIGDDTWYNSNGYMILYGKDGNFAIVANDGSKVNPNRSPVVVSEVREALGDKLTIDVKLKDKDYVITVNGKSYTVPAQYGEIAIKNPKSLQVALGVLGGGKIGTLNALGKAKNNYVSFVIAKASGMIDPEFGKAFGLSASGYNWSLEEVSKGTKVTHGIDGVGGERISLIDSYATTEGGVHIKLVDISSKDPNYSIAVMFGNENAPWYDSTGYMLIYGKSGNFAIVATDSSVINPNKSAVVVSEVREALGKTLNINVRLVEEDYKITVNGKTYKVPAEHEEYSLSDVKNLFISFGEFSDGEVGKLTYKNPFKKSELSFTISSVYHSTESVKEDEIPEEEEEKVTVGPGKRPDSLGSDKKTEENNVNVNVIAIAGGVGGVILLAAGIAVVIIFKKKKKINTKQSTEN